MGLLENIMIAAVRGEPAPKIPDWVKWVHVSKGKSHCETCLRLDKCWFAQQQMPALPQHPFCHCRTEKLPLSKVLSNATAICAYDKFDPYLFDPNNDYRHGKSSMLESWGYSVKDSQYLKEEVEKQGLEKYINGDHQLGLLNKYGQRISIRVEIPNKIDGGTVSFITGWMVRANGQITLNTPYGGK